METRIENQLKQISARLKSEYQAEQVILFGSHAKDQAGRDSDVDLLIIAPTTEKFYQRMASVRGLIRDLRKGLPVAPIVLTKEELKNRLEIGDQFVQEIIKNGIKL